MEDKSQKFAMSSTASYEGKKGIYDIETLSIDRVLNNESRDHNENKAFAFNY